MRHPRNCGCPKCVVYPTKHNVVHHCTEETIQHVHPSHTTVMNHHLIKNQHVFPHSTSVQNTVNSVDIMGPSFNVPAGPGMGMGPGMMGPGTPTQVAGAMDPGMGPMGPGMGPGMMGPGQMGPGMAGPGQGNMCSPTQVAGATDPGMGQMGPGMGQKPPKKWC
ncbi:CotD family spore coat protein [Ornithinibacillus halotolerans]|uniref:Spore coat protein D n=1 Tax=Ornithinibacillus halotolerans TaxID=1274357 RepID=A0A916S4K7_9BACI|nr:CotD family spore coat protein [Ornithinibacillus halotolerans]GGA80764.1 hypothetical protein GCM10008025_25180 [Ornithinibacillus halotolerans]